MSDTQGRFLQRRRDRLAREMVQLQNDIDHWNRAHPNEEPIVLEADLTRDIKMLRECTADRRGGDSCDREKPCAAHGCKPGQNRCQCYTVPV